MFHKTAVLRELLVTTKDGDWGKESATKGHIPYRVIRGADFPGARIGDISAVPVRYLKVAAAHRRTLQPSDILLETAGGSRKRSTGRSLLITEKLLSRFDLPATCASFSRFLRVDRNKAEPHFIFWYLQYLYNTGQMEEHQVQHTGVARFQYTRFAETQKVPLIPRSEQKAIAYILGTLDDKIELNRRMSETLEAMARTLFKSWFVDFDPVRAKAEGRDPGLPDEIADLFPSYFEDSELGEIPAGWKVTPLANHVTLTRGLSYKGAGLSEAGVPLHNLNSINEGGGYKYEGLKYYRGDYKLKHIALPGELIVANTEQGHERRLIGYAAIVPSYIDSPSLFSHHIYRVRTNVASPLRPDYLFHLLNSDFMHGVVSGYANGTTVNMLPPSGLQMPRIIVPKDSIVGAFDAFAKAGRAFQEKIIIECGTLAVLRDTLLPRLVSGEIRVPEAERVIIEAGD